MTAAERAHDILEANGVALLAGAEDRTALVVGRGRWYRVTADAQGVWCSCEVPRNQTCSHRLAAMVVWYDRFGTAEMAAA